MLLQLSRHNTMKLIISTRVVRYFFGRLLQNWLCLFFLCEQQHKHDPCFHFHRVNWVVAPILSHHSTSVCIFVLSLEHLNTPHLLLTSTFDECHQCYYNRALFRSCSLSRRWPAHIPFVKGLGER